MDYFACPLALQSGVTITIQAWPVLHFAAYFQDYRNLLAAFSERAGGKQGDLNHQLLIDRVVLASVPRPEDREQIVAADFAEILETIAQLNRLEEVAGKAHDLQQRLLQAEMGQQESPEPSVI